MSSHDAESYAAGLELFGRFNEGLFRNAMGTLGLTEGAVGADVGCGVGNHTRWLAEFVGPTGRVTGVDPNEAFLERAEEGAPPQVSFESGTLDALPFDDDSLDFVWCSDVLWPGPADKGFPVADGVEGLRDIVRVLRPGGVVALAYWSGQLLLPGHPVLESRLAVAYSRHYFGELHTEAAPHTMQAPAWLQAAGLTEVQGRSFLRDISAPLDELEKSALAAAVPMLWGPVGLRAPEKDVLEQVVASGLFDEPGYYGYVIYSLFTGRVA